MPFYENLTLYDEDSDDFVYKKSVNNSKIIGFDGENNIANEAVIVS